jgi:hypothetical protein
MLRNRRARNKPAKLADGQFYIPRLDRLDTSGCLPLPMILFVAQFRAMYDGGDGVPAHLELSAFEESAGHIHLLGRAESGSEWRFERFAPISAARVRVDLTGAVVNDHRLAPHNRGLGPKLDRLSRDGLPFHICTPTNQTEGDGVSHRLFIPMGKRSDAITHCLLMKL